MIPADLDFTAAAAALVAAPVQASLFDRDAANRESAIDLAQRNADQHSTGRVAVIGDREFFTAGTDAALYSAPVWNALDRSGYRLGARYESTALWAAYTVRERRAMQDAAELADRQREPIAVYRDGDATPAARFIVDSANPDPAWRLHTTIRPA